MDTKVGYWYSDREPHLPKPVANKTAFTKKEVFLFELAKVEDTAEECFYRGWSTCRICKEPNGTSEFTAQGFTWPSGFAHYVKRHNVVPPVDFIEMVLKQGLKLKQKEDVQNAP